MSNSQRHQPEAQAEGSFSSNLFPDVQRNRKRGLPSLALGAGVSVVSAIGMTFAAPAHAVDHGLLTSIETPVSKHSLLDKPAVTSETSAAPRSSSPIKITQQIRRRPTAPDPDFVDGQRWLCSVGQSPEVNLVAFRRAKAQGWGYWSFAAHAGCPPGIYLTVAQGGVLKATGENVWTDEPSPGDPLTNYTAMPSMGVTSPAMPQAHVLEYRQPRSDYHSVSGMGGFNFASGGSNAPCAACIDGACASSGALSDFGHAAWSYAGDSGDSIAGNSSGYCASCNGR